MKTFVARFVKDESGAMAIEYGLIAALIASGVLDRQPRVKHVEGAARRCYDYILFGLAAARQEPGPERRPHRPNVLSIASEVVASVVTA